MSSITCGENVKHVGHLRQNGIHLLESEKAKLTHNFMLLNFFLLIISYINDWEKETPINFGVTLSLSNSEALNTKNCSSISTKDIINDSRSKNEINALKLLRLKNPESHNGSS